MSAPRLSDELLQRNFRVKFLIGILTLAFLVLWGRLYHLQVQKNEELRDASEKNRLRKNILRAERGIILDRNGEVLVRNRPSWHIAIIYDQMKDSATLVDQLMEFKDSQGRNLFDSAIVKRRISEGRWRKLTPMRIYEDASIQMVSLIDEHLPELPGVITVMEPRRDYPHGTDLAHILGYTAEATRLELDSLLDQGYSMGDRVGRKGLEQKYEKQFKGSNGVEYIQVDAYGRNLGALEGTPREEPVAGQVMRTTIDLKLQQVAERLMPDTLRGALVAINPQNGEILAMVSRPSLDPNIFSMDRATLRREWAQVALNSAAPLNNRAIMGIYPPGSTFKFFTAIAGMEHLGIDPYGKPYQACGGGYRFGRRYQKCWKPSGHGANNMIDALRESCDVYFYQLGLKLGMPPINQIAGMYGLGKKTGVDLNGEKSGLLMDSALYNKRFARYKWKWTRGQILHLSIGQGQLATPLQIANAFAALAEGKHLYRPHLVKSWGEGQSAQYVQPEVLNPIKIKPQTQKMILQSLEEVISGPRGTGVYARVAGIRVGGKTGSSELGDGGLTHAWFAGVAPLDKPTIAVAVILEQAGHGGDIAAPIAGHLLRYYFHGPKALEKLGILKTPEQLRADSLFLVSKGHSSSSHFTRISSQNKGDSNHVN